MRQEPNRRRPACARPPPPNTAQHRRRAHLDLEARLEELHRLLAAHSDKGRDLLVTPDRPLARRVARLAEDRRLAGQLLEDLRAMGSVGGGGSGERRRQGSTRLASSASACRDRTASPATAWPDLGPRGRPQPAPASNDGCWPGGPGAAPRPRGAPPALPRPRTLAAFCRRSPDSPTQQFRQSFATRMSLRGGGRARVSVWGAGHEDPSGARAIGARRAAPSMGRRRAMRRTSWGWTPSCPTPS
jgi:hypothetical protein